MIIYPSLDLRGGKVVRLRLGDPSQQTTYSDDPLATAERWRDAGATWLHVINLDGAFAAQDAANQNAVRMIIGAGLPVQFGGGLRSIDDIRHAFELGVTRVVLGTLAVEQPDVIDTVIGWRGADALAVALDVRNGKVATHGWQQESTLTPTDLGKQMAARGAIHALYTDVSRDGQLSGVNVAGTAELARATGLQVIASGGVRAIDDVIALRNTGRIAGVILGTALYEGLIDLAQAIRVASEDKESSNAG